MTELSISDRLAARGITHTPATRDGKHILMRGTEFLGEMDALGALALICEIEGLNEKIEAGSSWVISHKHKKTVVETFDRSTAQIAKNLGYQVVPIVQHLQSLNEAK